MRSIKELINEQGNIVVNMTLEDLETLYRKIAVETAIKQAEASTKKKEKVDEFLDLEQVIKEFGGSKSTYWRWEKSNYLKPRRLGRKKLYKRSEIEAIMQ